MEYRATPAYHRCHKYICVSLTGVTSTSVSLSHSLSLSVSLSLSLCLSRGIDAVVCGRGGPFQAQRCSRVFTTAALRLHARGNRVFTTAANTVLRHGDRWGVMQQQKLLPNRSFEPDAKN